MSSDAEQDYRVPGPVFRYLLSNALYSFLKENPELRQGQAVMNLLRHPETGALPSTGEVWNMKDEEIHTRIQAMLKWQESHDES